jgi:hypothetical protein
MGMLWNVHSCCTVLITGHKPMYWLIPLFPSMPVQVHDTDVYISIYIYFGNEIR